MLPVTMTSTMPEFRQEEAVTVDHLPRKQVGKVCLLNSSHRLERRKYPDKDEGKNNGIGLDIFAEHFLMRACLSGDLVSGQLISWGAS
ncbi:MAG: hypothetical protein H6661_08615 [Ardenticatenaceae bacterium]|nr:hypothetical protein [Ardenticatenaceae bacterium]